MIIENTMKKCILGLMLFACGLTASAQSAVSFDQYTVVNKTVEEQRIAANNHQVITNFFRHNWFVLADAGVSIRQLS